jgi:hypothetical protein
MTIISIHEHGAASERRPTGRGGHPSAGPEPLDPDVVAMLRILGEAHFWPHAREAGDLSPDGGVRIALRGRGS